MQGPLAEIRRVLVDRYGCHTVLLYGSRAHGTPSAGSDWDVLGVRESGDSVREVREIGDAWLDAFIHPESHFETLDEGALRLLGAKVLVDAMGYAGKLIHRVTEFEKRGPRALSPDEEAVIRGWYPKMLERIGRDDVEARYRRAWLLFDALEAWFRLRGRFYRGPKQSFAWLKEHEPQVHVAFEKALAPGATHEDLSALADCVLGG